MFGDEDDGPTRRGRAAPKDALDSFNQGQSARPKEGATIHFAAPAVSRSLLQTPSRTKRGRRRADLLAADQLPVV